MYYIHTHIHIHTYSCGGGGGGVCSWKHAGMDTRAYRLKCLEGCHVYEVDLPKVLDAKAALLLEQQQEAEEAGEVQQRWRR